MRIDLHTIARIAAGSDISDMYGKYPDTSLEDLYGDVEIPDEDERDDYYGRNITWYTTSGKDLCRIPVDMMIVMHGNIFNLEAGQMDAWKNAISGNHPGDLIVEAPLADVYKVDLIDIQETQELYYQNILERDTTLSEPWSTGEEDVDQFLGDEEEWLQDNYEDYLEEVGLEEPEDEHWDEEFEEMAKAKVKAYMIEWVKKLVKEKSGDLGQVYAQIRNGNHRAFGAKEAGERFVWVNPSYVSDPEAVREVQE